MRIEIDAQSIYERLKIKQITSRDIELEFLKTLRSGEDWKQDSKLPERPDRTPVFGGYIGLPYPFKRADFYFERRESSYSGKVCLDQEVMFVRDEQTKAILRRTSQKMKEKYQDSWYPIDDQGAGYVLSGGVPLIVINNQSVGTGHDICIGTGGAEKRNFSSLEDFTNDMVCLEKVVTNFINVAFSAAEEVAHVPPPPDITLTLTC